MCDESGRCRRYVSVTEFETRIKEIPVSTETDSARPGQHSAQDSVQDDTTTARLIVLWEQPSDPEAFERHYREVHVPIARELPGLRSYKLTHQVNAVRGEPYYMVAELAWDTLEDLRTAFASPEGQATAADATSLGQYAAVRSMIVSAAEEVF